jgi:hypothetical protein
VWVLAWRIRLTGGEVVHGSVTGPIERINPLLDILVKGGIRPIGHALNVAVFDRIDMNVVGVGGKILLVADGVLSIPPLPDGPLTPLDAHLRARLGQGYAPGEMPFDQLPAF